MLTYNYSEFNIFIILTREKLNVKTLYSRVTDKKQKSFENLLSDWAVESQEKVDLAFDALKKIFLGLWT